MKIAVWHNLPSGGAKRALFEHVRGLHDRGHALKCWTPTTSARDYLPLDAVAPLHVVNYPAPFSALRRTAPRLLHAYQRIFCSLRLQESIARRSATAIERGDFELLYAGNCRYQALSPIARYVSIPAVAYTQEPYRHFYEDLGRNRLRQPLFRAGARAAAEQGNAQAFTKLLVNSDYSRQRIEDIYGVDADVCYLGIDADKFQHTGAAREDFFLGIGALQPHKRLELAVQCLARLPSPRPPLVWIGNMVSRGYLRRVRKLAAQLDVTLAVHVMVPDEELIDWLSRARALLYTSLREPFGLVPLEAAACSTPTVAVAEGGVPETVQDGMTGFLAAAEPELLAEKCALLLSRTDLADEMGRAARRGVEERWTLPHSIDRLEAILQRVIG